MKKPTDIERLFQRIGLTELRYHEFVPEPDPVRARENWSLVDSSVETAGEDRPPGHVPLARPAPPVRRSGAFYDRVAELRGNRSAHTEAVATPPPATEASAPQRTETPATSSDRPGGPLRDVFSRVRREPSEARSQSTASSENTPLSQVFKRLS